ncbi:MAG: FHA domain-containing protein [Myxococcota bacterium]
MGEPNKTSLSHPLHVDFLPHEALGLRGALGLCATPGRTDLDAYDGPWRRDLDGDLDRLIGFFHADVLVTLLERGRYVRDEFARLAVGDIALRAQSRGLRTEWVPMPEGGVPVDIEPLQSLVELLLHDMRDGRVVITHCRDGLGRSGLVACCCLVALGASPREALETVRTIRPGAVDDAAHRQSLRSFDARWRRRLLARAQPSDISDIFSVDAGLRPSTQPPRPSEPWRKSAPGSVPLSLAGAATIRFVGMVEKAARAGVRAAPLRPGDTFHVAPAHTLSVGRSPENDITIGDSRLSRYHCLLAFSPALEPDLLVVDLDSRHGTWMGGRELVTARWELGSELTLARSFRFRFESIG